MTSLRPHAPSATERKAKPALAVGVLDGREFREIVVPRTKPAVKGLMRLVERAELAAIRSACRRMMEVEHEITGLGLEGYPEWREEFNLRLVATAVRDPADRDQPLADVDEWRRCDPDQVDAIWDAYQDMQAELDPLGAQLVLEESELREMKALAKAADVGQLTSFGSQKLARLAAALASTDDPPTS